MKVEVLIYAYLAICVAMIGFNIVCIFVFRHKDKKLDKHSDKFEKKIKEQIERGDVDASHRKYLSRKLSRINHLMAFDKTLEELYVTEPERIKTYIESLAPVFIYLTLEYRKKNKLQAAYFPYIIKKYRVFRGRDISLITDVMLDLVQEETLYCRENALQAIYSIGDTESVLEALFILDRNAYYHHPKLITDGLLEFTGDKSQLSTMLWREFPKFSVEMQVTILDYFRFSSDSHCEAILRLMTSKDCEDEVRYSCIRYFGKYHYEAAFPYLLDYTKKRDVKDWESVAIAASALAGYPSEKTIERLKYLLESRNWYVRFNASKSLEVLGLEYTDLIDVFEGNDRYAGEMMRYRFDQKRMRQKGVTTE